MWPTNSMAAASKSLREQTYLSSYPRLDHPRQLEEHRCLVYQPTGPSWPFLSGNGVMTVNRSSSDVRQ